MKNISESDVNAKINESKRIYNHSDTIVFDYLGRCLLFDGIQFQLKAQPGLPSTMITMGSAYMAYSAYYAVPFVAFNAQVYGAICAIITLANTSRYFNRRFAVVRAYLMENRYIIRFENGNGISMDVPISGVVFNNYNGQAGLLTLSLNGKNYQLRTVSSPYYDPVLLYAISNPMVSFIEAPTANETA